MDLQDVFAKLKDGEVTFIEKGVNAEFDNARQIPLGFRWRGKHCEVLKILHVSKNADGHLQYLLLTNEGVFALALQHEKGNQVLCRSRWVLNYQVKNEQDISGCGARKKRSVFPQMTAGSYFAPLLLANVAHYHGHICPELAIGYRAALIAQEELGISRENASQFFILAENMSSAIESLQLITGCTIGNQNFFAYDLGKHVYYFGSYANISKPGKALRLALTNLVVDLSHKRSLEKRIISGKAGLGEHKEYQQAINKAVDMILKIAPEELFSKTRISLEPPKTKGRLDYIRCSVCGEVTALEKCNPMKEGFICQICSAKAI
jgi:formylmethanofuran dehydrogenase subunit E